MAIHVEHIICTKCGSIEAAKVYHTAPFWTYVHECACGYAITESEWESAKALEE